MKKLSLLSCVFLWTMFALAQNAPNDNATSLRGNNGTSYTFTTTGTNDGGAWGGADGVYTDDSRLGKAAVHAGLLQFGQTGYVTITILGGRSAYYGSTRNGVTTKDYGSWTGSYEFSRSQQVNPTVVSAPENMTAYRGNNGASYTFSIVGTTSGGVWGGANGIYTDDSKLSTAAVHAGIVAPGQQATIRVTVLQGQASYSGSTRHGVSSNNYGAWTGSYTFGNVAQPNPADNVASAPVNLTAYRGNVGALYSFWVTGTTDGSVWGGANGIYTDDSKLSTAAVHAGVVAPGQRAVIKVRILQGQSSYQGSTRNGIATKGYEAWTGSYRFE